MFCTGQILHDGVQGLPDGIANPSSVGNADIIARKEKTVQVILPDPRIGLGTGGDQKTGCPGPHPSYCAVLVGEQNIKIIEDDTDLVRGKKAGAAFKDSQSGTDFSPVLLVLEGFHQTDDGIGLLHQLTEDCPGFLVQSGKRVGHFLVCHQFRERDRCHEIPVCILCAGCMY